MMPSALAISRRWAVALALAISFGLATPLMAQTVVLDTSTGATFDAVLDGFPLPPPGFPPDGAGDFGGNALAVSLQAGVTEQRGIGEFPVAPLGGAGADAVVSATLTFNIDDVIGTFGPGTTFSGEAAGEIVVSLYAGDGQVALADFAAIGGQAHLVDTTPHGTITDQTLLVSGPIDFEVDVTDAVRALLAGAPTAIGVVWRTADTPTSTSIDNLGLGSAGPPGVNGSAMPFLTIELAAPASPTATPTATAEPPATVTPAAETATPTETATVDAATATATTSPEEATATATIGNPTPTEPAATATVEVATPTEPIATATAEATATATVVPSAATATVTATEVPTEAPTATATAVAPSCTGDCNGDGEVTVNEIITGVNQLLGNPSANCEAMDANDDGEVGVNELVQAVNALLNGC